jgi:hypothetical protein
MSKKTTVSGILLVLLVLATTPLLGTDNVSFLKWWLMTLVLGIGFYPAAAALFPRFHDRGWMFSKVLGIVVSGFFSPRIRATACSSTSSCVFPSASTICPCLSMPGR